MRADLLSKAHHPGLAAPGARVAELSATLGPGACPVACQQLVPGSDLLDTLDESANGPVWTSLWTAQDEVVTPPDSARRGGALATAAPASGQCAAVLAEGAVVR